MAEQNTTKRGRDESARLADLLAQAQRQQRYAEEAARLISQREIKTADDKRQAIEDVRANRRNKNRLATLVVALVLGFTIPTVLPVVGLAALLPYSFSISILLDAGLSGYAFLKKF